MIAFTDEVSIRCDLLGLCDDLGGNVARYSKVSIRCDLFGLCDSASDYALVTCGFARSCANLCKSDLHDGSMLISGKGFVQVIADSWGVRQPLRVAVVACGVGRPSVEGMRTRDGMQVRSGAIERMASEQVLWAAWSRVAAGSGMAGADGVTAEVFGREVGPRLATLSRLLRGGRYRAQPLRPVRSYRGGKERVRGLPTICDRIVQRAFLNVCGTRLSGASSVSFSYRPGRSWLNAIEQVQRHRDSGLRWVLRTDIADFFASIDQALLVEGVRRRLADRGLGELVGSWVRAPWLAPRGATERLRGLPEGAPVSPALAEFFLSDFDAEVDGRSGRLVRYADDLTVLCLSPEQALSALSDVERSLASRGLRVNPAKTYIADFGFGFSLLGWRFIGGSAQPVDVVGREGR